MPTLFFLFIIYVKLVAELPYVLFERKLGRGACIISSRLSALRFGDAADGNIISIYIRIYSCWGGYAAPECLQGRVEVTWTSPFSA